MSSKFGIPDRWLEYEAVGKQIDNTPFIAFKVPLRDLFTESISPEKKFSPSNLMQMLPNLSLVIDLTNTEKYYNSNEFRERGVEYQKIFCPGHQIPSNVLLKKFFDIVDDFARNKAKNDGVNLIGVHCTHGINRTGFFICSYLINKLGYNSEKAIFEFNSARRHPIERENYLFALKKFDIHPFIASPRFKTMYSTHTRYYKANQYSNRRGFQKIFRKYRKNKVQTYNNKIQNLLPTSVQCKSGKPCCSNYSAQN